MMVEMIFYICMVILFTTKTIKQIEFLGLAFVSLLIPIHSSFIVTNYPGYHRALINWFPMVVYFPLFFSGIIFYRIKFDKPTFFRYVLILLCFVVQIWLFRDGFRRTFTLTRIEYLVMLSVWYMLFLLYVHNKLAFLINKVTLFLGAISFSLYLVHQFIGLHVFIPFFTNTLKLPHLVSIGFSLILIFAISYCIMICVEKPSMNYIRAKYKIFKQKK
jgi:peptidoglycan/LPS O-acetylase OafA/YrhL